MMAFINVSKAFERKKQAEFHIWRKLKKRPTLPKKEKDSDKFLAIYQEKRYKLAQKAFHEKNSRMTR